MCNGEGLPYTSVKLLVGLNLSVGVWLADTPISQGLLRFLNQWNETWVGFWKETQKHEFMKRYQNHR